MSPTFARIPGAEIVYFPSGPGGGTVAKENEADNPSTRSKMLFIFACFVSELYTKYSSVRVEVVMERQESQFL